VRWVWLVGLSLLAGHAEAKPHPHAPPADPNLDDFWREVIEPHGEVVTAILVKARATLDKLREESAEGDAIVDQRSTRPGPHQPSPAGPSSRLPHHLPVP